MSRWNQRTQVYTLSVCVVALGFTQAAIAWVVLR